jgi:GMP synthase (glutamine-hydrolysing)
MANIHHDKILILDFGSQYTQLIARRVREIGIYCELLPYDVDDDFIKKFNPKGVILSGGPDTVTLNDSARAPQIVFDLGVPILGICYGMQTMATQLGGQATSADKHEYGFAKVRAHNHSSLLNDIADEVNTKGHGLLDVSIWSFKFCTKSAIILSVVHFIEVNTLPDGFQLIASTDNCAIAGFANVQKHYYGLQFHPEVTHTKQGKHI